MPILAGWGGKRKRIGNFGIHKCPNCNNWRSQGIYEVSRQATLYFIPIAKWGKEYYVICPVCEAGVPVSEGKLEELLQVCMVIPDDEKASEIFNAMDIIAASHINDPDKLTGDEELKRLVEHILSEITKMNYPPQQVDVILTFFIEYLIDLFTGKPLLDKATSPSSIHAI